jgi:hypothetical protein
MKRSQLKQIIKEEIRNVLNERQVFYSDDSKIDPRFIKQTTYGEPTGNILFKINTIPSELTPTQNQQIQKEIFIKHFGKMDPMYSKLFFTNKDKWSSTFPSSKNYNFKYLINFNKDGSITIGELKSTPINQPQSNNPDTVVLPFNIYYVQSDSQLRNIGLDEGVKTEPELMWVLWNEYQNMQGFERTTKSGGDKYTNKMQDIGVNMDFDADADKMFYGETMRNILNNVEVYVSEGSMGKKESEDKDPYTNFIYGIYYGEEGEDFKYSKQEADKYQYMLTDDDSFKDFVETIKTALL